MNRRQFLNATCAFTAGGIPVLTILLSIALLFSCAKSALGQVELIVGGNSESIAVADGKVYFSNERGEFCPDDYGRIRKVAGGGGDVSTLQFGCDIDPGMILTDGVYVYYGDHNDNTLKRVWVNGDNESLSVLAEVTGLIRGMTQTATEIYWGDSTGVHSVLKDGSGSKKTLVPGAKITPGGLAVEKFNKVTTKGTRIYWAENPIDEIGGIWYIHADVVGLPPICQKFWAARGDAPCYLAINNGYLYWADTDFIGRVAVGSGSCATVIPISPPDPPEIIFTRSPSESYRPGGLAVDDKDVFWAEAFNGASPGRIYRTRNDGSTPVPAQIAIGLSVPGSVNLDASYVYWEDSSGIKRALKDAAEQKVDLRWLDMEITQGIQNMANDVLLVQDKTTYVRVFPTSDFHIDNVEALLHGTRDGVALPPLRPISQSQSVWNSVPFYRLGLSYVFFLPSEWLSGELILQAEINPDRTIPESNFSNNSISHSVDFIPKRFAYLAMIPVSTHGSLYTHKSPGFWEIIKRFETLWPISGVKLDISTASVEELQWCFLLPCFGPYELPDDTWKVLTSLYLRSLIGDSGNYVGMVSPDTNTGEKAGAAKMASPVSWVKMTADFTKPKTFNWPRGGSTLAHEVSHNFNGDSGNRWDHVEACEVSEGIINPDYPYPPCQIGPVGQEEYYGFDAITQTVIPPDEASDYMSYESERWVSDYNWRAIMLLYTPIDLGSSSLDVQKTSHGESPEVFVVTGQINSLENSAAIETAYRLDEGFFDQDKIDAHQQLQDSVAGTDPSYALDLVGADGTVLLSQPFAPMATSEAAETEAFVLLVPYTPGTASFQVKHNDILISELAVSPGVPTVSILSPEAGQVIDDSLVIELEGSDPDGDFLTFIIQYSSDNGVTWTSLTTNYPQGLEDITIVTFDDISVLPGSDLPETGSSLIRVIGTDGTNTAVATSGVFTVLPHAPIAHINAPSDGTVFYHKEQIILEGIGYDAEEKMLDGSGFTWVVEGRGSVGSGKVAVLDGLPPGTYQITLNVVDGDWMLGTDQVTIEVGTVRAPDSFVLSLPATTKDASFTVQWTGQASAGGSAIAIYDIYVSVDNGPFNLWLSTADTSALFNVQGDGTYSFYSVATDNLGYVEQAPDQPDATTTVSLNSPPFADAGANQFVSVGTDCSVIVTLDGSSSFDEDGDEITYRWQQDGQEIATGVNPTVELDLGIHTIELIVNDGHENSLPDYVTITVEDITPPELTVIVDQDMLWPPNHKMVKIGSVILASDNCDNPVSVTLLSITMNEGEETNTYDNTSGDLQRQRRKNKKN